MSEGFARLQRLAPQHGLTRLIGRLAASRTPWVKRTFIERFARAYQVNMAEAEPSDLNAYACFNDFFTRPLKSGARPLAEGDNTLLCPADGAVSQAGAMQGDTLLQAKGLRYTVGSLAGPLSRGLTGGSFLTVYLAPKDYHRVHLPFVGRLTHTLAVPGALFSVNGATEQAIEGLFCRNERLVCRFETRFGPMLVVLVGAMIVASIETVWSGPASPYRAEILTEHDQTFAAGDEIGRFLLGSTVICCFPPGAVNLDPALTPHKAVRMGQALGLARA